MSVQIISFDIGIKNLAYCIMNKDHGALLSIKCIEKVDLQCHKSDHQKIMDSLLNVLEDIITNKLDISIPIIVLIESQMTSIMKCIQTAINVFFKIHGRYQSIDVITKYVSPRHKLNLIKKYQGEYVDTNTVICSTQYKQNKLDAVRFGEWLLKGKYRNEDILMQMAKSKKFDDEMDCFLMGVYYVENG
jgi:hypothetical protein